MGDVNGDAVGKEVAKTVVVAYDALTLAGTQRLLQPPHPHPHPNPNPNPAAGSEAARAAYHAGSRCLLESSQQFAFVCGREEKPTRAARELAALCMRSLKVCMAAAGAS